MGARIRVVTINIKQGAPQALESVEKDQAMVHESQPVALKVCVRLLQTV